MCSVVVLSELHKLVTVGGDGVDRGRTKGPLWDFGRENVLDDGI